MHGPILQSVLNEITQLDPQNAAKLAVSLAGHYQRNPVEQGLHVNSAGIWELGEKHHILPKSDGGTNHPSNMVVLPVAQHFYVHVLLARSMVGTAKETKYKHMVSAFSMFSSRSRGVTPEEIAQMRVAVAETMLATFTFTSARFCFLLYYTFLFVILRMHRQRLR